jgi:hypothetical protein
MSAICILLATVAGLSFAPVMSVRPSAAAQMSLELACHRLRPASGITLKARIRNRMSEPASIVVAYVRGNDVEDLAPGLVFLLKRRGSSEAESFHYWPHADRSGGGTGRLDRRLVAVAPEASFEWSIDGPQLLSLRTHKPFDSSSERGELQVVFNSSQSRPGELPRLWNGRLESNVIRIPEGCKYGG